MPGPSDSLAVVLREAEPGNSYFTSVAQSLDGGLWREFLFLVASHDPVALSALALGPGDAPEVAMVALLADLSHFQRRSASTALRALIEACRTESVLLERLVVMASAAIEARFLLPLVDDASLPESLRQSALRSLANSETLLPRDFWVSLDFKNVPGFLPIAVSKLARTEPGRALSLLSEAEPRQVDLRMLAFPVRLALRSLFSGPSAWSDLNGILQRLPQAQSAFVGSVLEMAEFRPGAHDLLNLSKLLLDHVHSVAGGLSPVLGNHLASQAELYTELLLSCLPHLQKGDVLRSDWQIDRINVLVKPWQGMRLLGSRFNDPAKAAHFIRRLAGSVAQRRLDELLEDFGGDDDFLIGMVREWMTLDDFDDVLSNLYWYAPRFYLRIETHLPPEAMSIVMAGVSPSDLQRTIVESGERGASTIQ